jgi:putative ABC transport system permease protein
MFENYFKIAFRNLWKHKVFSFINIMGLTVGMTACFLIFLYVRFELSYDNMHGKADRIYRLVSDIKTPSDLIHASGPAWAVPPNTKHDFPEVEEFVRVSGNSFLVRKGNIKFQEEKSVLADSAFFKVFDFPMVRGNRETALSAPLSLVLTESTAKKYFGKQDAMGQTLLLTGDAIPAKVTAVIKDIPENSQIQADMIVSMSTLTGKWDTTLDKQWGNYGSSAFLLLKPGADPKSLEKKFPAFLERRNGDEMEKLQMYPTLFLEPLRDVYLHSTRDGAKTANIKNVYIFSLIAIFILLIACINFINLTTARSTERAKEVGIRKVVGAIKNQLAKQFIGESVIVCVLAFIFTFFLAMLLIPPFNQLAGKTITTGVFDHPGYLALLFGAAVTIGLLAGFYPALVLSSFQPITVLKGKFSSGAKGIFLRKGLVILQFSISIVLITGTLIVYQQMNYMRNQNLGFDKEQMVVIESNGDPAKEAFRQSLTTIPSVKSVALSSSVPGGGNPGAYSEVENQKGDMQIANLELYFVDFDYIPNYSMKMVAGRAFSRDFKTDTTQAMVLNESAVKLLGYASPRDAVGKRFRQWGREGKIIGVMKDFHFRSLQQEIKPLSMRIEPNGCHLISANITGNNVPATLAAIEEKWKTLIPNRPFNYFFLDEFFDRQYRSEQRFGNLFLNFAILAIFISCLGLLGLASYSTYQRTREIGIRKVMGASVSGIVHLLSKEFLALLFIAFVIASPIAWLVMHRWLEDFSYRIGIHWWIFMVSGMIAFLVAIFTVSFQAIRAALVNPVISLRTE